MNRDIVYSSIVVLIICIIANLIYPGAGILTLVAVLGVAFFRNMSLEPAKVGGNDELTEAILESKSLEELIKLAGPPKATTRLGYDDVSVGLIPMSDNLVLICQSKVKTPTGKNPWGFAKGHVEPDETEREAANRENLEELGLDFSGYPSKGEITMEDNLQIDESRLRKHLTKMILRKEAPHVNRVGVSRRLLVFFPIQVLPSGVKEPKIDQSEVLDAKWVSIEAARQMMIDSDSNQIELLDKINL